jgi:hypothetical protein
MATTLVRRRYNACACRARLPGRSDKRVGHGHVIADLARRPFFSARPQLPFGFSRGRGRCRHAVRLPRRCGQRPLAWAFAEIC